MELEHPRDCRQAQSTADPAPILQRTVVFRDEGEEVDKLDMVDELAARIDLVVFACNQLLELLTLIRLGEEDHRAIFRIQGLHDTELVRLNHLTLRLDQTRQEAEHPRRVHSRRKVYHRVHNLRIDGRAVYVVVFEDHIDEP